MAVVGHSAIRRIRRWRVATEVRGPASLVRSPPTAFRLGRLPGLPPTQRATKAKGDTFRSVLRRGSKAVIRSSSPIRQNDDGSGTNPVATPEPWLPKFVFQTW